MYRCVCVREEGREVLLRVGSRVERRGRCVWRWESGGGEESREACVGGRVEGGEGDVCERGKCVWKEFGGCVEVELYMGRREKCCMLGLSGWVVRVGIAQPGQLDLFNLKKRRKQQGGRITKHMGAIKSTEKKITSNR